MHLKRANIYLVLLTLNLVATMVLKDNKIETFCEKIKRLVTLFKQSVVTADELQKYERRKLIHRVFPQDGTLYTICILYVIMIC